MLTAETKRRINSARDILVGQFYLTQRLRPQSLFSTGLQLVKTCQFYSVKLMIQELV
jgi:hypothetical protein